MREGMRIAQDMNARAKELARLTSGDKDAAVEVLVGYAVILVQEANATPHSAVASLTSLCPLPDVWFERVVERIQQEISHVPS